MQEERLRYLLTHYFRNTISRSELKEMLDKLDQLEEAEFSDLFERMGERVPERSELFNRDQVLNQISSRIGGHHKEMGDGKKSKLRYIRLGGSRPQLLSFVFQFCFWSNKARSKQLFNKPSHQGKSPCQKTVRLYLNFPMVINIQFQKITLKPWTKTV